MSKIEGPGQAPKTMAPKKASEAGMVSLEDCPPETAAPPKSDAAPARDSQAPSEIKPTDAKPGSLPPQQPDHVAFDCPPEAIKPVERTIEVAGAGMGSYKKYTMLESEALAVYTIIRDNKGSISPQALKEKLKERYGIDADITTVDGHIALVNKATGNAVAVDTEGNGALGFEDLQFKDALLAAGIDPDRKKPHFNPFDLAMKVITEANDLSKKRQQEEQAAVQRRASAQRGGSGATAADIGQPGGVAPGTTPTPAAPSSTPSSSPPPSSGARSGY